jgi:hypothetical protein
MPGEFVLAITTFDRAGVMNYRIGPSVAAPWVALLGVVGIKIAPFAVVVF